MKRAKLFAKALKKRFRPSKEAKSLAKRLATAKICIHQSQKAHK